MIEDILFAGGDLAAIQEPEGLTGGAVGLGENYTFSFFVVVKISSLIGRGWLPL